MKGSEETQIDRDMPRICNMCHRIMFSFRVDYNHYKKNHAEVVNQVEYHTLDKKNTWHNRRADVQ